MKHYGDITKLSGYTLPVVDCITGGSPCQNLSIAGNGEGLDGEQSKLFYEQIRVVKEMRERDRRDGRTAIREPEKRILVLTGAENQRTVRAGNHNRKPV